MGVGKEAIHFFPPTCIILLITCVSEYNVCYGGLSHEAEGIGTSGGDGLRWVGETFIHWGRDNKQAVFFIRWLPLWVIKSVSLEKPLTADMIDLPCPS